jgi:hypothetical protein
MKIQMKKIEGWQDFLELGLASWLLISPFVLGFFSNPVATLACMFAGCVVVLFSLLGMATHKPWDEWVNLFTALALITTPWLLGFTMATVAATNAIASGLILAGLAIYTMMSEYREIHEAETGSGLSQH